MSKPALNNVSEKEAIEVNFWRDNPIERPESAALENILSKCAEARIFLEKLSAFQSLFASARDVLELGGGQCWASCIVKRQFPSARVVGTDISPFAVASVNKWQHMFGVKIDQVAACRSYATQFENSSFDLIFAYAAAHHFVKQRRSLVEISRLLRPGGAALYLHEPACRQYVHRLAVARIKLKRPEVPEDVLVYPHLRTLAAEAGLNVKTHFAPTLTNRGPVETIYYYILRKAAFLQDLLPCTVDIVFRKPDNTVAVEAPI